MRPLPDPWRSPKVWKTPPLIASWTSAPVNPRVSGTWAWRHSSRADHATDAATASRLVMVALTATHGLSKLWPAGGAVKRRHRLAILVSPVKPYGSRKPPAYPALPRLD